MNFNSHSRKNPSPGCIFYKVLLLTIFIFCFDDPSSYAIPKRTPSSEKAIECVDQDSTWAILETQTAQFSVDDTPLQTAVLLSGTEKSATSDESTSVSMATYRAALVLLDTDGNCLARIYGHHKNNEILVPFGAESSMTLLETAAGKTNLIQVQSNYSHGFSEKQAGIFVYDPTQKNPDQGWTRIWSGATESEPPVGYPVKKTSHKKTPPIQWRDLDGDGAKDLLITPIQKNAKPQTWYWKNQKLVLQSRSP